MTYSEQRNINNQRNFGSADGKRGLQESIPKPNIVRIELLDGNSRGRYLGTLQKISDKVRAPIYQKIANDKDGVFFGFLRNKTIQSYGLSSNWERKGTGGGILGTIKAQVDKAPKNSRISKAIGAIDMVSDIARDLTGINAKFTGSSSMKRYTGSGLANGFSVDCGWYLPEQFLLCVRSLRILHKMIYPIKVNDAAIIQNITEAVKEYADKKTSKLKGNIVGDIVANLMNATTYIAKGDAEAAIAAIVLVNRFFGRELTFDPLPVRLCIGQYMDIEPLVMTNMKIDFSKETYINKEGRHVPLTCSVNIQFKFWMNPAPDLNFLSLLGHEMFGNTNETSESNKELVRTYKE